MRTNPASTTDGGPSLRGIVLASFIGTTIEWYDFFLYGTAAALVFDRLFFPEFDPLAGKMAALATYSVGFFARPLGGIVFGHFGDRVGRKAVLVVTLVMMGLATFLIGLLPTYHSIGVMAPVLLVVLRFVQGLGVGGEWGGAVLMVVEHGHAGRRGLYGSWAQAGVPVGMILSTGVFALFARLPDGPFLAWGWRIPFLLGIVLVGVGLFIRLQILESPLFSQVVAARRVAKVPILAVLRTHPRNVLLAMGTRMAENMSFYVWTVFVLSYGTERLGLPRQTLLAGVLAASGLELVTIPLFGRLSDRLGRRPVSMAGVVLVILFAFPFFWLLETRSPLAVGLALAFALGIVHASMYGPQAAFLSELFGTNVRYTGASLGYQMAAPLAGGLAPLIATALLAVSDGRPWPVALYMIAMALVSLASIWLASETARDDLAASHS